MGDVIDIQTQPDKGHTDIDISSAFGWINDRFRGVPPPNSCLSFEASERLGAIAVQGLGQ
jgi:hypothetical protein